MEPIKHAILSPSGAFQWVECAGAPSMQAAYPETERHEAAEEGTASHWVGSEVLDNYKATEGLKTPGQFIGKAAPNGIIITDEMTEGAEVYIQDVLAICQKGGLLQALQVEKTTPPITRIHPECWGTPDAWAFDENSGVLYVWDYKFGHREVDPFHNWQGIIYAIGIMEQLWPSGGEPAIVIDLRIAQPRCFNGEGPIKSWRFGPTDLHGHINRLRVAAKAVFGDSPQVSTGSHCRDCTARHACPGAQRAAMKSIEVAHAATPEDLSNEAVGIELMYLERAAEAIKARLTGLEAQALHAITKKGAIVPGWDAKRGNARKRWVKPVPEVLAMGELFGVDLISKAVTPTQAIAKGIDEAVIKAYSETPLGAIKLSRDNGNKAKKVFSK